MPDSVTVKHLLNSFRATNVGFGLTYTLPVIVALLASDTGSLIMIENPEAHLHPFREVGAALHGAVGGAGGGGDGHVHLPRSR